MLSSKTRSSVVVSVWLRSGLFRWPLVIVLYAFLTGFDLSRHGVPADQILDGGTPKDGIPAILQPKFVSVSDAAFLMPSDRVVGVVVKGKARAYPLKILNWHEVVDDAVGGTPLAATFCPLTQSAIVYDRKLQKKPLTVGVSGKLYESNLLFYDKATESLWSQIKGEAIAGPLTGKRLEPLPSVVTAWAVWRKAHPDTVVLDISTGYSRNYGINPYESYESSDQIMFPVTPLDDRLPAKERVLGLTINQADEAFPFSGLAKAKTPLDVNLGGTRVTVIFDQQSQTAGAMVAGRRMPGYTGYWFAWAAFHPKTGIWEQTGRQATIPASTGNRDSPPSGLYGYSGAVSGAFGEDKMGVVGECIWIYDRGNQKQVATGYCFASKPGEFRVALAPGAYVVRGPGGNRAIEVKQGQWTRIESVVKLPAL